MINKQDILDRATEWRLRPDIVEKDYVLGWLLAGLASHPETRATWVFKGGTCIKKCYFETYRFSEDLDFSLLPEAPYTETQLRTALHAVTRIVSEVSGIEFPPDLIEVRSRADTQGKPTFQGRIAYRGPLSIPTLPRVLLDLTQHEPVLDPPVQRTPFHPYPDDLPDGGTVLAYSLEELLAEKTRALYERTRPRDLYDVVYLLENRADAFDLGRAHELFRQKCAGKGLQVPSRATLLRIVQATEELRAEWLNMLAHQLPQLPDLEALWPRLPGLLAWIDQPTAVPIEAMLSPAPTPADTIPVAPAGIQYWGGAPLETIRFAGASRLLLEFIYDGTRRLVEPYSLRQAATGNLLLYAWEQGGTHIKAFNIAKMADVRPTTTPFQPRYRIEFTPGGPITAPPTSSPPRLTSRPYRAPRPPGRSLPGYGPTYVFECVLCSKKFRRSANDPRLRKHKSNDGWDCPGRHGYLVNVE
ncbi:MAG TPA: nucleotidyl transferase AbiEii/AbiGii toxin family protein [Candidatus Sulfotelmatobacter sp.]|nr:nucleotidyl transferase AbiEii/AbiGii toxin family protein [Candidatus Sulfotelmatobacter sp.]